jgi:hypothetical protein
MDKIINFMVQFEQQLRVYHWQTKSYARHMAYGGTYDALSDLIDAFVESYMGKYGRVSINPIQISNMISENDIEVQLTSFMKVMDLCTLACKNDTDLLNIKDEMLAQATKLKYLITLQ